MFEPLPLFRSMSVNSIPIANLEVARHDNAPVLRLYIIDPEHNFQLGFLPPA